MDSPLVADADAPVFQVDIVRTDPILPRRAQLPPELIDAIIELLHDDRLALATCALVRKSWVPASRHHLFSEITIVPQSSRSFAKLLSSSMCTIAPAVQHLKLVEIQHFHNLVDIASRLNNISKLSLANSMIRDPKVLSSIVTLLQDLDSLHLLETHFRNFDMFLSLLHHPRRLRSMSCTRVRCSFLNIIGAQQSLGIGQDDLVPHLESLKLHGSIVTSLWLGQHWSTPPHLTTLDLDLTDDVGTMVTIRAERLLEAIGSNLQVLCLRCLQEDLPSIASTFVFLAQLRSVSFALDTSHNDLVDFTVFIRQALRQLTSPCLENLAIIVPSVWGDDLAIGGWSELNSLLESSRFSSTLRALTFRFLVPFHARWDGDTAGIVERFPLFAAHGIVKIQVGPVPDKH